VDEGVYDVARRLGQALAERGWKLAMAESCTGGLVSSLLTDLAGSSAWYAGGVVVYSNEAKRNILGVPQAVLDKRNTCRHGGTWGGANWLAAVPPNTADGQFGLFF